MHRGQRLEFGHGRRLESVALAERREGGGYDPHFSKSVGSTWGKKLDHFYYGRLTSGTPETADFEIVVEDGMGNTYRTSKLQTDFIGF